MGADSPNDALWDLDVFHGDEFLQLIQAVHILYLTAELGAGDKSNIQVPRMHQNKHKCNDKYMFA